jgi:hypothetical protein
MKLLVTCLYCGKDFYKEASQIMKYKRGFCSRKCVALYCSRERFKKVKIERKCEGCGNIFYLRPYDLRKGRFKGRFCSIVCYKKFRIERSLKRENRSKEKNKLCKTCGKPVYRFFCSNTCSATFRRKKYIERWKCGLESGVVCKSINDVLRDYILKEHNYKCDKCGWAGINPYSNRSTLQINHINGNPYDNSMGNHEVLCPNCHSLTKHWGSLNMGHGRTINKPKK